MEPQNYKVSHSIKKASEATDLSKSTLYKLMKEGKLKYVMCGRRRLILASALDAYMGSLHS